MLVYETISRTLVGGLWVLAQGVSADRVDLLPLAPATVDHLATYGVMDISLDPWPYAGTTTTCESLFMGEPKLAIVRVQPPQWLAGPHNIRLTEQTTRAQREQGLRGAVDCCMSSEQQRLSARCARRGRCRASFQ